jgi:hypothetical protein
MVETLEKGMFDMLSYVCRSVRDGAPVILCVCVCVCVCVKLQCVLRESGSLLFLAPKKESGLTFWGKLND